MRNDGIALSGQAGWFAASNGDARILSVKGMSPPAFGLPLCSPGTPRRKASAASRRFR
jgi:hypothetical protein